jgi:hypothetical protein
MYQYCYTPAQAGCGEIPDFFIFCKAGCDGCPGVAPSGYTMMHFYRGIIPFVIIQVIGLLVVALFPQLAIYLPDLFFGR